MPGKPLADAAAEEVTSTLGSISVMHVGKRTGNIPSTFETEY